MALPLIIVDDGSDSDHVESLRKLIQEKPKVHFFAHSYNRGKGAAVITGFYHARALGYTHAVQIDADGQHDHNDIADFIEYSQHHPSTIISGQPYFDQTAPKIRIYGRRLTDYVVSLETLSFQIKDGLCGFRVYPLTEIESLLDRYHIGSRMDFDTDILVKAVWENIPLHFMPTKVVYHEHTISHFHYWRDNFLLIKLHIGLIAGMLLRFPMLLFRPMKAYVKK